MKKRQVKSRPGLWGTVYYYDENGNPIGKSHPGLITGTRIYTDQNGKHVGKSRPGFLAKEVYTDTENNHFTSYDCLSGEIHFKNGIPIGYTQPGFFGTTHTTLESETEMPVEECFAEIDADTEEDFQAEFTPGVSSDTIKRNIRLFVWCLAICAVLAGIYAIARLVG